MLGAIIRTKQQGLPVAPNRQTDEQYLVEWLEGKRGKLRPRTWQRYEQYVRLHALPVIGRLPLMDFGPQHVQQLLDRKLAEGASSATVHHLRAVLGTAMGQAVRWGRVPRNVVALVDAPRVAHREMQTLSPDQVRTFLSASSGDRFEALYVLAITTGMRQGELLALRWSDVDVDTGHLRVSGDS